MNKHREEHEPDFVDGVAAVENETGRDRHGERGQPADIAADERLESCREMNAKNADEDNRQPQGPKISPEQSLRKEEHVKVQRPVIIGRIVFVETGLHHLIDEPAVDPFVEMRRLDPEQEQAKKRAERDDQPRRPIDFGGPGAPRRDSLLHRGRIC